MCVSNKIRVHLTNLSFHVDDLVVDLAEQAKIILSPLFHPVANYSNGAFLLLQQPIGALDI